MSDPNNAFSSVGDFFIVPSFVMARANSANINELKVALYFSANRNATVFDCAAALGIDSKEVETALAFWRGAADVGTQSVSATDSPSVRLPSAPDYDGKTLAGIIEKDPSLRAIMDDCQKLIGKTFTPHDTEIFVGCLYDWLSLSPEYILSLTSYCCERGKKNVRYIEKTALSLVEEGIDDFAKLEAFIAEAEKENHAEYKLRKLFGFGDRALTASEKKHFALFTDTDFALCEYAYEKMIKNIGTVRLAYMSKIIQSWKEKGVLTLEAAKKEDQTSPKVTDVFSSESFEFDDFLSAAIKKGAKKKGKEDGK
jgi:hypothetical protein